jgi:hypothetical protein
MTRATGPCGECDRCGFKSWIHDDTCGILHTGLDHTAKVLPDLADKGTTPYVA